MPRSTASLRRLEPHISPRQAAVGGVACIAVVAAVGFVHRAGSPQSTTPTPATVHTSLPSVAPHRAGDDLGSQDRAAAEAVASEFVGAALSAANDAPETQRRAVQLYDTARLDSALAASALSDDLTGIQQPARVDGVVLLVASNEGVDARVEVSASPSAVHVVSVTLRRDRSGWKVDDVVAAS